MYRIVDTEDEGTTAVRDVAQFDSAYAAVDALRSAVLRGEPRALWWRVVDPGGGTVAEPHDVVD